MSRIIIYTIALGTAPIFALNILQIIIEKLLKVDDESGRKSAPIGGSLFFMQFFIDIIFFVVIPTLVYYWLYPVLPFVGFKAGIAVGLSAYILGSLPYALALSMKIKIPAVAVVTTLFFNMLKLTCALGVITHYLSY